jgi:predicted ABC-type sugar transport system permease subunit
MKNSPLTIGIILIAVGLIGIVFSQFSVLWMWALVIVGIVVIIWTGLSKKSNKDETKK